MDEPLKIAICEDDPQDLEKLSSILEKSSVPNLCTVFHSGEELLASYQPQQYDLLLTDIYMSGITGVDAVTQIRTFDEEIPICFITSSSDHTLESYRLSVLRYIEKPYQEKSIADTLKLALMERNSAPALVVQKNGALERIRFSRILYLEQQSRQLAIILRDGQSCHVYEKISVLQPQFDETSFFMPHKSFLVNLAYVRLIDPELKCFRMADGKNIPIRRGSMTAAKHALQQFLYQRTRGSSS